MSTIPETPASTTNSIEIFIDADGRVTFTDLPEELKRVAESLCDFTTRSSDWCELFPRLPEQAP